MTEDTCDAAHGAVIDRSRMLIRIVDDEADVRDALRFMLEAEGWRVSVHASAEDFLESDRPEVPGVCVLDVRMPGVGGTELFARLRERTPAHPVIFLSGHGTLNLAVEQMRRGAFDFMEKPIDPEVFLARIGEAAARDLERDRSREALLGRLSRRERQIAAWVLRGLSNREMAEALGLSERTVENHRASLYRKLGVNSARGLEALLGREER